MDDEQENQLIDSVCSQFNGLPSSVDTLEEVHRVFNECVNILTSNNLHVDTSPDFQDFVDPADEETSLEFKSSLSYDDEITELFFSFDYGKIGSQYLIFVDVDFDVESDDDSSPADAD